MRHRRRSIGGVLGALLMVLLMGVTMPVVAPPPPAVADGTGFPVAFETVFDFGRDPVTGTLWVSGEGGVQVFDNAGAEVALIEVAPLIELEFADGAMWAAGRYDSRLLVRIDTTTFAVEVVPIDESIASVWSIAAIGGSVWFTGETDADERLWRLDPGTGALEDRGAVSGSTIEAIPGRPGEALLGASSIQRLDLTADPVAVIESCSVPWIGGSIVVSHDGTTFWAGARTDGLEHNSLFTVDGCETDGRSLPAGSPVAIAADTGAVVAAAPTGIYVYPEGSVSPTHRLRSPSTEEFTTVSDSGDVVYNVADSTVGGETTELRLLPTAASISATEPGGPIERGLTRQVRLRGVGLGQTTATIDGVPVASDVVAADEVLVHLAVDLAVGSHTVALTGPAGTATTMLDVIEPGPGTIRGTVRLRDVPFAGATVTVSGPTLPTPVTAITGGDGKFAIPAPPRETRDYRVTVHDPDGLHAPLTETATSPADLWLDLGEAPLSPYDFVTERVEWGRIVGFDELSDRYVVDAQGSLRSLDADGNRVAEVAGLPGEGEVSVVEGHAYTVDTATAEVIDLDLVSGSVARWPVGRPIDRWLAIGSGRAYVLAGSRLVAVDLGTGATTDATPPGEAWSGVNFSTIPGASGRIIGGPYGAPGVWATSASTPSFVGPLPEGTSMAVASASRDRLWTDLGVELVLSTLDPTGSDFAGAGRPALSEARGGVLVLGRNVISLPNGTQAFTPETWLDPVGIDVGRARMARIDWHGSGYHLLQLQSIATSIDGSHFFATQPSTVTVDVRPAGGVTEVRLDGTPVPFTQPPPGWQVQVRSPGLSIGVHEITVTSFLGTATAPVTSVAGVPDAPTDVTVTPRAGSLEVSWTAPGFDGGAPIVGYVATAPGAGSPGCVTDGATTCTLDTRFYGAPAAVEVKALNAAGASEAADATPTTPLPLAGEVSAHDPARVYDSRTAGDKLGPGETIDLHLGFSSASGAVLNVTAVAPTADTHVTVWPTGAARPATSNLNITAGDTRAAMVTVPFGTDGAITLRNNSGDTDLVIDVVGAIGPIGDGLSTLMTTAPSRLYDSRTPGVPIHAKETRTVPVTGTGTVPVGAKAVLVNVTAVDPSAATHLSLWSGTLRPSGSTLNVPAGETRANLALVPLAPDGKLRVFNNAGNTHVVLDVVGYLAQDGPEGFAGVPATRALDTRRVGGSPLGPRAERSVTVAGVGGVPSDATAVTVNLTGAGATAATHLTTWASGSPRPHASTVNIGNGRTAANLAVVPIGPDGKILVFNNAGTIDVIVDIVGYTT